MGRDHSGKQGRRFQPHLPAHPARAVARSRFGGGSGPSSGLAVCRERVEGTGLPNGDEGLSAELPGSTTARGWGLARVWLRLWTGAGVLLEDSTVSEESQGPRPNSGSSFAADLLCGLEQVIDPLWASVSTSV